MASRIGPSAAAASARFPTEPHQRRHQERHGDDQCHGKIVRIVEDAGATDSGTLNRGHIANPSPVWSSTMPFIA